VLDIKYPSGREMRLVNVYNQLRQEGGLRSQDRPAETARWGEIIAQNKSLLGGDWNAHSNRWDPKCPPKRDEAFPTNLMDTYDMTYVTDGEATPTSKSNCEILRLPIDFFITKARMAGNLVTATDLATTSDHAIVCAHLVWDEVEVVKVSKKVTGWDMDGLKSEEEKEIFEKAK